MAANAGTAAQLGMPLRRANQMPTKPSATQPISNAAWKARPRPRLAAPFGWNAPVSLSGGAPRDLAIGLILTLGILAPGARLAAAAPGVASAAPADAADDA